MSVCEGLMVFSRRRIDEDDQLRNIGKIGQIGEIKKRLGDKIDAIV